MRRAVQRLLTSSSALSLLRNVVRFDKSCVCHSYPAKACQREYTWGSSKNHNLVEVGRKRTSGIVSPNKNQEPDEENQGMQRVEYQAPAKFIRELETDGNLKPITAEEQEHSEIQSQAQIDSWRTQILTFDQIQYQSTLEARLIDNPEFATNWTLWLELIRFRNRRNGSRGTRPLYRDMFRRQLQLPIHNEGADELWDLLLQSGFENVLWMNEILEYAFQQKRNTGKAWAKLYGSIIGHSLQSDQGSVLRLHQRLKEDFPPAIEDYRYLFDKSLSGKCVPIFMSVYRDLPITGMYATIVPELCKLRKYKEARKWHHLLCSNKDLPRHVNDIKHLLVYLVQRGDDRQLDRVIKRLDDNHDGQSSVPSLVRKYVAENEVISRGIMNRRLGEIHGVAPKHLSDEFCARLFATKLIGINTIISGLQMMGVTSIGPLSLREMASRDACDAETVCQRLDRLKDAGISPDSSTFSTVLVNVAHNDHQARKVDTHHLLRSVVQCDLHPDTFGDFQLQERLLSQYYEQDDQVQIERTLAIITSRCITERQRDAWRWNLSLRACATLGRADEISSTLEEMQRKNIELSRRSSQHLRCELLSERHRGDAAQTTKELLVIIKASQLSMKSGHQVPIIAWREIMRRLGMAGRLLEFENLALWLTDYYSGITAPQRLQGHGAQLADDKMPQADAAELSTNTNVNRHLKVLLYHYAAQQAIVTWGFLHQVRSGPENSKRRRRSYREAAYRPNWKWGLVLLKKLQKRGVPIQKRTIARICRIRLLALFGSGISSRPINREAKWVNDRRTRHNKGRQYQLEFYIKQMEAIWGNDLFRHHDQKSTSTWRRHLAGQGPPSVKLSQRWLQDKTRKVKRPYDLHRDKDLPRDGIDFEPYFEEFEVQGHEELYTDEWD